MSAVEQNQHSIRRILSLEKLKRLPDRETVMNRFSQPQFGDEYVSSPLANSSTRASQAGTPPTHRSSTPPVANSRNPQPPVAKNQPKQPQTRFSVNSNLMNYSMPKDEKIVEEKISDIPVSQPPQKVVIHGGESSTRIRQLESQVESLTLQTVKLQRVNRLLKIDADNLIKEKTKGLEEQIAGLTLQNVRLQRANRLLMEELEDRTKEVNQIREDAIIKMNAVGPEYEYLVQMVNLLHRQITGHPDCGETCCFTETPVSNTTVILPSDAGQHAKGPHHICRPVIHSPISRSGYAVELEKKSVHLEEMLGKMDDLKEELLRQLEEKDTDTETLKQELRIKDEIVSQLEEDFVKIEEQVSALQKQAKAVHVANANGQPASSTTQQRNGSSATLSSTLSSAEIDDLSSEISAKRRSLTETKRRSQILLDPKRNSGTLDVDLLNAMINGEIGADEQLDDGTKKVRTGRKGGDDHELGGGEDVEYETIEEIEKARKEASERLAADKDKSNTKSPTKSSRAHSEDDITTTSSTIFGKPNRFSISIGSKHDSFIKDDPQHPFYETSTPPPFDTESERRAARRRTVTASFISSQILPCHYNSGPALPFPEHAEQLLKDPFAPFTFSTLFLGIATLLGIKEDWSAPVVLALWVGIFLWSGAAEGMQFKLA